MIIRAKFNTGKALRYYEDQMLLPEQFGKFGASEYTQYGFSVGEELFVVGMLLTEGNLRYLINSDRLVGTYPYQLFEMVDTRLPTGWCFNAFPSNQKQAV